MRIRLADHVSTLVEDTLTLKDGRARKLPRKIPKAATLCDQWQSLNGVEFPKGLLDALFQANLIEVGHSRASIPLAVRLYLAEQFPNCTAHWPLEEWVSQEFDTPIWLAVPYESPRELGGSTAAGCARIIGSLPAGGSGLFGILPGKSPTHLGEQRLLEILDVVSAIDADLGLIGGDHRVTWSLLRAQKKLFPQQTIVHIQFDAHHDLYGSDKNITQVNPANFNLHLLHGGIIDALAPVGCRDTRSHIDQSRSEGYTIETDWRTIDAHLWTGYWHLSIDLDILDPKICQGVTNPLPNGWIFDRLLSEVNMLFRTRKPNSVSIVEATSCDSKTIELAVQIKTEIDHLYANY